MRTTLVTSAAIVAAAIMMLATLRLERGPLPSARPGVAANDAAGSRATARLEVPASIRREHQELHEQLDHAIRAGGRTGQAAQKVEGLLRPHLAKEEQYALPPLGMLRAFADGEVPAGAEEVLALTERFRAEYPRMLEEHDAIAAALGELLVAARAEGHAEVAGFAQTLLRHAQSEEEILYPTAVLVGEYLKLLTARDAPERRDTPPAAR